MSFLTVHNSFHEHNLSHGLTHVSKALFSQYPIKIGLKAKIMNYMIVQTSHMLILWSCVIQMILLFKVHEKLFYIFIIFGIHLLPQ